MQSLRSDLENTKHLALQAIVENQEQQEKQTVELGIKRHINSTGHSKNECRNNTVNVRPSDAYKTTEQSVDSLIHELKKDQLSPDCWFQLKDKLLSCCQLNKLLLHFEALQNRSTKAHSLQGDTQNSTLRDIERLLIDKYRLATLQEIAKQLPAYQNIVDNPELTPETAARYLFEAKENNSNISCPNVFMKEKMNSKIKFQNFVKRNCRAEMKTVTC
jgi:hypothetical protein